VLFLIELSAKEALSIMKLLRSNQVLVACLVASAMPLAAASMRLYITNAAGDRVHVIDTSTNKVVEEIEGIEIASGVSFSPDAKRLYFTCEGDQSLVVVDRVSKKILGRAPLTGRPNSVETSPDGKLLFVAIAQEPGAVDIVDAATIKRIKSIPLKGPGHYVYITPDKKYIAANSVRGKFITLIDIATLEPVGDITFRSGVRPVAFELGQDGLTSRMFVQLSDLIGFQVVDFKTRKITTTVKLPEEPVSLVGPQGGAQGTPAHGIAVSPDNKTLWVNSSIAGAVFIYSLPDLKLLATTVVGDVPDWLAFTPDSKVAYISNSGSRSVSAIDMKTFKEIARIPVGEVPKRSGVLVIP
jgi:YVTN family beta-propeller protein